MTKRLIAVIATADGFKRIATANKQHETKPCSLGDCLSFARSERPDVIVIEIHSRWSLQDTAYIRSTLHQIRNVAQRLPKIVLYLSSSRVAHFLGMLLFADEDSDTSSNLVDAILINPPLGYINAVPIETQAAKVLAHFDNRLNSKQGSLPALGESSWAPTLCDPKSLELWFKWLPRYASYTNESPLIVGETGTGKTSLAAAIHYLSKRQGPFVTITPRDFSSPELVQAELFGAVAGAYTGAVDKWGLVKKAEGGTLFIDELQSIDVELQGKLITFIENKKYRRVGAAEQHSADVRFVFASNKTLDELVSLGQLRDDFAYRLERLQLRIPPLRERPLDIIAGACRALALIHRVRPKREQIVEGISNDAMKLLYSSQWPGNLRQLENVIAQSVERALAANRRLITEEDARSSLEQSLGGYQASGNEVINRALHQVRKSLHEDSKITASMASAQLITYAREFALESCSGDLARAAELLGEDVELLEWVEKAKQ